MRDIQALIAFAVCQLFRKQLKMMFQNKASLLVIFYNIVVHYKNSSLRFAFSSTTFFHLCHCCIFLCLFTKQHVWMFQNRASFFVVFYNIVFHHGNSLLILPSLCIQQYWILSFVSLLHFSVPVHKAARVGASKLRSFFAWYILQHCVHHGNSSLCIQEHDILSFVSLLHFSLPVHKAARVNAAQCCNQSALSIHGFQHPIPVCISTSQEHFSFSSL